MLTGVNRIKTTGRGGSQIENAIPPTSTGAVASSQGARAWFPVAALRFRHFGLKATQQTFGKISCFVKKNLMMTTQNNVITRLVIIKSLLIVYFIDKSSTFFPQKKLGLKLFEAHFLLR